MNIRPCLAAFAFGFTFSISPVLQADEFDTWDASKDGKLEREELPERLRPKFDRVDANGDGAISRAEHEAVRKRAASASAQPNKPQAPPMPDSVKLLADIPYAETDNAAQRLDLMLPAKRTTEKLLPVIVFIHGGGWRGGSKLSGRGQVLRFVQSGDYAGVSVEYRLSGEAQWPAQMHDCKAAIRWLKGHAKEYGLDAEKIAAWGSSAGGHLAAMLGVSGDVPELEGALGKHTEQTSRVTCVADWYGPTNLLTIGDAPSKMDHYAADSPVSKLLGGAIQEQKEKARNASPITWVSSGDAPVFIAHGTADPTVPFNQTETFEVALKKANVPVFVQTIEDGAHGGFDGPELQKRVQAFFDKYLCAVEAPIESGRLKVRH
ncbi:MAG: alpha/beta hydrolase fold domain-containing protein [Roseimicrobium sp.]